ncbi:MAG: hypothetical protein GY855_09165, partial [candidate division Zixibacteria bacterium]|nr:hypothetical protein [candidate division Zixibacteria bacterium]
MNKGEFDFSSIVVRPFQIKDYEDVVNLWDYSGLPYRSNGRDSKEQIRQEIKSDSAIFLIAETNGMVIGVVF